MLLRPGPPVPTVRVEGRRTPVMKRSRLVVFIVVMLVVSAAAGTAADGGDLVDGAFADVSLGSPGDGVSVVGGDEGADGYFPARPAGAADLLPPAADSDVGTVIDREPAESEPAGSGLCDSAGTVQFSDVADTDYAAAYILCMRALGLSQGRGDGGYGPDGELNRGQMASFLIRLWTDHLGKQCPTGVVVPFTDTAGTTHEANIECLFGLGITQGTSATTYGPQDPLKASQISRFLFRTYVKAGGDECNTSEGSELERTMWCLLALQVVPSEAEGTTATPVTRAQMAVYLVGLWHNLTGRGRPPTPPQLGTPTSPTTTTTQTDVEPPGAPRNVTVDWVEGDSLTVYWQAPSDGGEVDFYALDFIQPGYFFPAVDSREIDDLTARAMRSYIGRHSQPTANTNLIHDGRGNYQYKLRVDEQDWDLSRLGKRLSDIAGVRVVAVNDGGFVASTGVEVPTQTSREHDAIREWVKGLVSEYGARVPWLTEVWEYILEREQSVDARGGGFRSEGFRFDRASHPTLPDRPGYADVGIDCSDKELTVNVGSRGYCVREGWAIGVDSDWPPPVDEYYSSFGRIVVHELAHIYTLSDDVSHNPLAVAAGHLYIQEVMMLYGIWTPLLIPHICSELELFAQLGLALVEEQWSSELPLDSLGGVNYGWACGIPLTGEGVEVTRDSYGGRVPQWFYDAYQKSDGTYDLDGLWADVSLLSTGTLIGYVVRSLADMFGGYCPDFSGAGNPWRDGGCGENRPDHLRSATLSIESDPLEQSGSSSGPRERLSVALDAPAGYYDIECWASGSNEPWFTARWHWPAFPQWSKKSCDIGRDPGNQAVWVVVRSVDSNESVRSNEVVFEQKNSTGIQFLSVSAGHALSCGITTDHSIECWGVGVNGTNRPPHGTFSAVSVGYADSCAIRTDGTLQCWGSDDDFLDQRKPAGRFRQVSVAVDGFHACAISVGGTVECWGNNRSGQSEPPSGTFIDVSTVQGRSCGVRSDRTIICWGRSLEDGGTGGGAQFETPSGTFEKVSTAGNYSCAIRTDQTITCWGSNDNSAHNPPTGTFTDLSVGAAHACGIRSDQTMACWGGREGPRVSLTAYPVGHYSSLSAGVLHTCALRNNGSVECWGRDTYGQTDVPARRQPVTQNEPDPVVYREVSGGWSHSCGLRSDGSVVCWGKNDSGQATAPAGVFTQVSAGGDHSCGLRSDGSVVCWGKNDSGQATAPAGVFTQVSAGGDHSCGLRSDGSAVCWGQNGNWQATAPAGVFTQVSAGGVHSCGLRSDGSAVCWGGTGDGEATAPAGVFTQVSAGSVSCGLRSDRSITCWGSDLFGRLDSPSGSFTQITVGGSRSCGLRSDEAIICWGSRLWQDDWTPPTLFTQISAGSDHLCGLRSDGSIVCWGNNRSGQRDVPE